MPDHHIHSDLFPSSARIAAVVIGRNEGTRLIAALDSLTGQAGQVIYVDSGSTDDSLAAARARGAQVIELDLARPFTAARARNAGLFALADSPPEFVQFLDGDCEMRAGWLSSAVAAMDGDPRLAAVGGRRRERSPRTSVYNRLCDAEWDTPVGPARALGGDMLVRYQAIAAIGGFREALIAGEEPEMCVRLRAGGWRIRRLGAEMTLHDADMTRFRQWWRRTRRAGYAFAEGAALHGKPPERHWVAETRRAVGWGAVLPLAALAGAAAHPAALLLLAVYPAQFLRLSQRMGAERAAFTILGKFPESQGVLEYWVGRWRGRRRGLIEYK